MWLACCLGALVNYTLGLSLSWGLHPCTISLHLNEMTCSSPARSEKKSVVGLEKPPINKHVVQISKDHMIQVNKVYLI